MYLIKDTETNGKYNFALPFSHPSQPRIVQLAAQIVCKERKVRGELNILIKPDGWDMPDEVVAIHGITLDDCQKYGVPIKKAISMLDGMIHSTGLPNNPDGLIIGHNIKFDIGMVRAEIARLLGGRVGQIPYSSADGYHKYCTMTVATNICKIKGKRGNKWPNLAEAVKFFLKREQNRAHDAMGDVIDARDVFFAIQDWNNSLEDGSDDSTWI